MQRRHICETLLVLEKTIRDLQGVRQTIVPEHEANTLVHSHSNCSTKCRTRTAIHRRARRASQVWLNGCAFAYNVKNSLPQCHQSLSYCDYFTRAFIFVVKPIMSASYTTRPSAVDSYGKMIHPSPASTTEPLPRGTKDVLVQVQEAVIEARAAVIQAEIADVDAFKARERAEQAKNELKDLIEARSRLDSESTDFYRTCERKSFGN